MKTHPQTQTVDFAKTNVPNLFRHKSGKYYSRLTIRGKRQYRSLETDLKSEARQRLNRDIAQNGGLTSTPAGPAGSPVTCRDCLRIYKSRIELHVKLAPDTKKFYFLGIQDLVRLCSFLDKNPAKVTTEDVNSFLNARLENKFVRPQFIQKEGVSERAMQTRELPEKLERLEQLKELKELDELKQPEELEELKELDQLKKLKKLRKLKKLKKLKKKSATPPKVSASTYNNALRAVRAMLDIAVEQHLVQSNVARNKTVCPMVPGSKSVELPSREDYQKLINHLLKSSAWKHREAAYMVECIASTGGRIGGIIGLKWKHIQNKKGQVIFYEGDPRDRTFVPLNRYSRKLFKRLKERRGKCTREDPVFKLRECQGSIDRACAELGIARLTHHDFRHLFATRCIESGVDIPTVAQWLGHKDKGVLCMKVYSHLLDAHSQEMAKKVRL